MKDLKYLQLFDCYGGLFTEHQRDVCRLYYVCDLSLAEIAEEKGCSRQSVSDCLQTCRRQLCEYEEKLGFFKREEKIRKWAEGLSEKQREELDEILRAE